MSAEIVVNVRQVGPTTSEGSVRGHTALIDRPVAKEGMDKGMMGGEMLLVSLGGCFMSNLLAAIRSRSAPISNVSVEIAGALEGTPPRYTAIRLKISADHDDHELLEKLVTISERACIVANTLRPAVDLSFEVQQPHSSRA